MSIHSPRRFIKGCLIMGGALLTQAAVVQYEATGTFTRSDFPTEIPVGDQFSVVLAYDDAVTDTNPNALAGRFPGALVYFDFRLMPGATGTYRGGSATVFRPIDTFDGVGEDATAVPDRFYAGATGGNFGPLNGHAFGGVLLVLDDYSHTTSINDSGEGQTLNALLGGQLDLQQFKTTLLRVLADGKNGVAEANITGLALLDDPVLKVSSDGRGNLRIRWSADQPNFVLETTSSLTSPDWKPADAPPLVEAGEFSLTVKNAGRSSFYRLHLRR
jgi:hypothetical protein